MQNNEGWFSDLLTNVLIIGISQAKALKNELLSDISPISEETPLKAINTSQVDKQSQIPKNYPMSPQINLNYNDDENSARPLIITVKKF